MAACGRTSRTTVLHFSRMMQFTLYSKGGSRGVSKVSRNWSDHLWLVFACISLIMSMLPYSYTFMCWKPVISIRPSIVCNLTTIFELLMTRFAAYSVIPYTVHCFKLDYTGIHFLATARHSLALVSSGAMSLCLLPTTGVSVNSCHQWGRSMDWGEVRMDCKRFL